MDHFLQAGDFVGVSFWIVSVAMVVATVFFFYEGMAVKKEWRLSMTVAGLVTSNIGTPNAIYPSPSSKNPNLI